MRITTAFALAGLSSLLFACDGADPGVSASQDAREKKVGEAAEAVIAFDAEWNETVDGELVDGGRAIVDYDDERLAECRGEQGGVPQYAVTAHARLDGGETQSIVVAGLNAEDDPAFDLDGSGTLEIWFEATSRWGCHAWDSNFGDNYVFEVAE
jgi:hypothetical protein